ncbi:hypothetical protein CWATWH0003_5401 [Crocosphaera watsonii WH 0003]|nr:hypothetical protein CWATWH0003_5401 [Crocosphaera watsonii WH 0003]
MIPTGIPIPVATIIAINTKVRCSPIRSNITDVGGIESNKSIL